MPFDGTTIDVATNPLASLGLTPIANDRTTTWRNWMVRQFIGKSDNLAGLHRLHLVQCGMAKWRETPNFALKSFPSTHWHTPKSVKQLAAHVATVFPAAFCSVQYFDKDPILYIHLDGKRHCLAIWDKGVVRAVPDGWKLPLRQRIARHFVKLV